MKFYLKYISLFVLLASSLGTSPVTGTDAGLGTERTSEEEKANWKAKKAHKGWTEEESERKWKKKQRKKAWKTEKKAAKEKWKQENADKVGTKQGKESWKARKKELKAQHREPQQEVPAS